MCNKNEVGRCVYYKSKNENKIDSIVDSIVDVKGASLDISFIFGNQNDATIAINRIPIIVNKINVEKYIVKNNFIILN
jgi:hypothetical protein